jgi:hypothetical protein
MLSQMLHYQIGHSGGGGNLGNQLSYPLSNVLVHPETLVGSDALLLADLRPQTS